MSRLTPRGAPDDEREILLSVTSRRPLELVHNSCSKAVRDERHDWQDSMAEWAVKNPARHVGCSSNCADSGECDCSHAYGGPRQPRRIAQPGPSLWLRIKLWWTSFSAGWGR